MASRTWTVSAAAFACTAGARHNSGVSRSRRRDPVLNMIVPLRSLWLPAVGRNAFHGALFETMRNNGGGLVARARQDGNIPAKLIRNEYGGWAGGPIVKNKTFWMFNQEYPQASANRTSPKPRFPPRRCGTAISATRSTPAGTRSRFTTHSQLNANGLRQAVSDNIIPEADAEPKVIDVFQGVSPTPNGPNAGGNPWIESNFQAFYPRTTDNANCDR